jgi:MFS family permease
MDNRIAEPIIAAGPVDEISAFRRWYMLVILALVGSVSIIDRQIINILIESIRRDLSLSDSQIGFITGLAFAATYMVMCIPAARLADRWSRPRVIAIAVTVWSVMTILCGAAQNFLQLFLARVGVGFGEAGGNAPSQAIVGDIFPRQRRATAMSILLLASPIGIGTGLLFGGWAVEHYGWRTTFLLAGLPGLILGPLVFLTFPTIRKGMADGVRAELPPLSFFATLRQLLSIPTIPYLTVAGTLTALLSMGISSWVPAFLLRSHGMSQSEIGASLGLALGTGSLIGHIVGGPALDLLGKRDLRWHFWVPMITVPAAGLFAAVAFLAPLGLVFWLLAVQVMLAGLIAGPMVAIIMTLAPVQARATASACIFLIISSLGVGLGPQLIGIISDLLRPAYGEESLRWALLSATLLAVPALLSYLMASRHYRADIAAAQERNRVS